MFSRQKQIQSSIITIIIFSEYGSFRIRCRPQAEGTLIISSNHRLPPPPRVATLASQAGRVELKSRRSRSVL